MKKEEIHLSDIPRILLGNAPAEFLLEVFIRTFVVYLALQLVMRFLGKRMNGKITIAGMTLVLTMGAIVSVPMQSTDRGVLQGLLVLACAFFLQRFSDWLTLNSDWYVKLIHGRMTLLVKDGVMQRAQMRKVRISTQQLFGQLRAQEIYQLGEVERVYMEACGHFSVYKASKAKPGLSTIPPSDYEYPQEESAGLLCNTCGAEAPENRRMCTHCGGKNWSKAIL